MPVLLEKTNSRNYELIITNTDLTTPIIIPIESRMEGLGVTLRSLLDGDISSKEALASALKLENLSLPYSLGIIYQDEEPGEEFRGMINFFEKKIEAEETGKPSLFKCVGCGLHAFLVGKEFLSVNSLDSKHLVNRALRAATMENFLSIEQAIEFTKQLDTMKLKDYSSEIEIIMQGRTKYGHTAILPTKRF